MIEADVARIVSSLGWRFSCNLPVAPNDDGHLTFAGRCRRCGVTLVEEASRVSFAAARQSARPCAVPAFRIE